MRVAAVVLLVLLGVLAVLPFFGAAAWWLDMAAHFRTQLLLGSLLAVLLTAAIVRRWWVLLGLLVPLVHLVALLPALTGRGSGGATLIHVNVGGCDQQAVSAWLATQHADAVFLLEVRPGQLLAESVPAGWRVALDRPTNDSRGVRVLVPENSPLGDATLEAFTVPKTTREMSRLDVNGYIVLHAHLARPGPGRGFVEQVDMSRRVAEWVAAQEQPVVILGDFNAAPWSAAVAPLSDVGLSPAASTLTGTWPAPYPPYLRVPIDHAWATGDATVHVGPNLGGDHRPITVTLP